MKLNILILISLIIFPSYSEITNINYAIEYSATKYEYTPLISQSLKNIKQFNIESQNNMSYSINTINNFQVTFDNKYYNTIDIPENKIFIPMDLLYKTNYDINYINPTKINKINSITVNANMHNISKYDIFNIQPLSPFYSIYKEGKYKEQNKIDDSYEFNLLIQKLSKYLNRNLKYKREK